MEKGACRQKCVKFIQSDGMPNYPLCQVGKKYRGDDDKYGNGDEDIDSDTLEERDGHGHSQNSNIDVYNYIHVCFYRFHFYKY